VIQESASAGLRTQATTQWITTKINATYIKLHEPFNACDTKYNWKK